MRVRSWYRLIALLATAECVLALGWAGLFAARVAAAPQAAVGILPPTHPRHNCVPPGLDTASASSLLASIDYCRAMEHVGSMHLPSNFRDLTAREQLFVLLNLERVNRGEPPVLALTGSLDASGTQARRRAATPPYLPARSSRRPTRSTSTTANHSRPTGGGCTTTATAAGTSIAMPPAGLGAGCIGTTCSPFCIIRSSSLVAAGAHPTTVPSSLFTSPTRLA